MALLQTLAVALGLAALSGLSLYLTVFATGVAIHQGWVHLAPQFASLSLLGEPIVIIISGLLFALEFFADKIPWVDSIWDILHTVIRPLGGALLAIQTVGAVNPLFEVIVALLGGSVSLASHSLKAGTRLMVNGSPEPLSNVAVSTGENLLVVGGTALLWKYPILFLAMLIVALAIMFYFLPPIWRSLRTQVWLISRKLNQLGNGKEDDPIPRKLPGRYYAIFRRIAEPNATLAWAVPCISGRGLPPNRFGYLIASEEQRTRLFFVAKKLFGGLTRSWDVEGAKVFSERHLLFDELTLTTPVSKHLSFKFDRAHDGIVGRLIRDIEMRLGHTGIASLPEPQLEMSADPGPAARGPALDSGVQPL
ncbi:MAG: DUF4126 domain-containing protein [Verrucomicrobia bacterium]|nr:DUF4126 domain-containing protein [Verrucomicrobiota bacterium]